MMIDLAVIGSGFGGLTAAALASKDGLEVAVFEQHTRPGGCAGDFALEGFWFPAGATVITGLEPGGILRRVFEAVDIETQSTPLSPSITMHIDGRTIPYETTLAAWQDVYATTYPDAPDGYRKFWEWTAKIGGAVYDIGAALPSLPIRSWADVRRTLPAARPGVVRTAPYLFQTVERVKRGLGATGHAPSDAIIDSLLMDATGAPSTECSAIQGAIALDLYRRGCQWVEGSTGKLAMQFVRAIRANGGEVHFATAVRAVRRTTQGWSLHLSNGERVLAKRVVANIPPSALAKLRIDQPTRERLTDKDAWGAFVVHVGIDASGLAPMHPFHQVVPNLSSGMHDGGSVFTSIYPGRGAKANRWSISLSTHTRAAGWYSGDVARRREALQSTMLCAVEQVIPCVRERAMVVRNATPRTFERFTQRPGGYVGGLIQRPSNVALFAAGHRPEPGLFLAGDHVFPGQGTVGVALSGINAYRDVAESLGRKPLL